MDSTTFNRLVNNIKAHCDRNATPQVPPVEVQSPVMAAPSVCTPSPVPTVQTNIPTPPLLPPSPLTPIKKHNSRKISLTCQRKRTTSPPPPLSASNTAFSHPSSVTTIKSPPAVHPAVVLSSSSPYCASSNVVSPSATSHHHLHHHHAKSKSKSAKNRLKSPLPSPIVSPLPSPSRNRFQVSKVSDPGLSPLSAGSASTGSSPTFFTNSRFSVTRVVLPPTPVKANSVSTSSLQSTLPSDSESPDVEVKRYMNDSCSSLDSMDRNNDLNVSMSSTDSFDFILNVPPAVEPVLEAAPFRLNASLSSLDVSASSQESLTGVTAETHEESSPKVSSNEGTLTNSPCDKDGALTPVRTSNGNTTTGAARVRKNSWIPNPIAKGDSGSVYPATLDKLFSLFQHPTALFQRSSPDTTKETPAQTAQQPQQQQSAPVRKDSPMGGLFAWASGKTLDHPVKVLQASQANSVSSLVVSFSKN